MENNKLPKNKSYVLELTLFILSFLTILYFTL